MLVVSGFITLSECHGVLRDTVRGLIERGRKRIVLNLEAVPFIDSNGLGELVSSYTSVVRLGGTLRLASVNPPVADALGGVGLRNILRIVDRPSPAGAQAATTRAGLGAE